MLRSLHRKDADKSLTDAGHLVHAADARGSGLSAVDQYGEWV